MSFIYLIIVFNIEIIKKYIVTCNLRFANKDFVQQHTKQYYYWAKLRVKKNLLKRYLVRKSNESEDFDAFCLKCEVCEEQFFSNVSFALHLSIHNDAVVGTPDKKYFYCHFCPYKTQKEENVRKHMRRHDGKLRFFECEICKRSFKEINQALEHKYFHSNEFKYACSLCSEKFIFSWLLKTHLRIIHGHIQPRKPKITDFRCDDCDLQYKTSQGLRRHNSRIHNCEVRTYLCDICGKSLANVDSLKFHKRAHIGYKPHSCSICGKSFTKKEQLKEHFRVHSGEKPFICSFCGKGFTQRGPLKIHLRIHTGERPYKCIICGKGCICKSVLDSHMKTCTGRLPRTESTMLLPKKEEYF